MKEVVGIAFLKNGELLISQSVKSAKQNKYTLVGGKVENGETIFEAAVRECKEEIQNNFVITKKDLKPILDFTEHAASDPSVIIHMYILLSMKNIDVSLTSNDEILHYKWFNITENQDILSSSISKHLIPYLVKEGLMF